MSHCPTCNDGGWVQEFDQSKPWDFATGAGAPCPACCFEAADSIHHVNAQKAKKVILLRNGATRWVLLVGRYAFKIPRPIGRKEFRSGVRANLNERRFGRGYSAALAPVLFSDPLGFLVVMPRCAPIPPGTVFGPTPSDRGCRQRFTVDQNQGAVTDLAGNVLPVELKPDSFGVLNNEIVAIDYGN